jgi:SAM-dependent methyltransferase
VTGSFGAQAGTYHAFRPGWPAAVFEALLACTPERGRALDLGAGTGHVARVLAEHFAEVVAVEPDARMLAELEPRANLRTLNSRAEDAELEPACADLVTAGNAFHWMDGPRVCAHVARWLRPGGCFAVFRYDPPHAAAGALERVLQHEYEVVWAAHVHPRLRDPDHSRRTLAASSFGARLEERWLANDLVLSFAELLGFLRSTSYGGGHARAEADPEAYWADLGARIRSAAGDGPFVLDFRVQLLLAAG